MPGKKWPRLALLCAAVLLALLAAEVAYRYKLFAQLGNLPLGMSAGFMAVNESPRVASDAWGYTLQPDRSLAMLLVSRGQPVEYYERRTNELGNFEPPKPNWRDARLRVAVFGDSCTATWGEGGGGMCWPTLWEERLRSRLGDDACVLNFARDGYGVLQMLDLASAKCDEFEADVAVIAFIADDLNRQRLSPQSPQRDVPAELADPQVSLDWCHKLVEPGDHSRDPLLASLCERFDAACHNARPIDYFTLTDSFLVNRLARRDPFYHLPTKRLNQRIEFDDYADDAQCVAAVKRILERDRRLVLLQLPTFEDVSNGRYVMTGQQNRLHESLQKLTRCVVVSLSSAFTAVGQPDALFLLPHDPHPSQAGLRFYAQAVDEELGDITVPIKSNP